MSAVAEPATKTTTPFKKKPTKYHYRLGKNKMAPGMATGGQGKVLSVLSAKAYMTARDVANALRIESHVAQGLLQRLLIRGAVERRIIPGSVYDETPSHEKSADETPAKAPVAEQKTLPFKAGDIVQTATGHVWLEERGVITRADESGFDVVSENLLRVSGHDRDYALYRDKSWSYDAKRLVVIGPTPNPIAFNHGKYAECFEAPKSPVDETVKKVGEKVDEVNNALAAPFNVGDVLVGTLGGRYEVVGVEPGALKLRGLTTNSIYIESFEEVTSWASLEKPTPKPTIHPRPELLPLDVLNEVSKVFAVGAAKYERDDWALPGNGGGDHVEAAQRHIDKFNAGHIVEAGEKGSGLHHLDHAIARLMMARGKALRANQCS